MAAPFSKLVQSVVDARERLLHQGSNNSLRRLAIMHNLFETKKRQAAEDANDKDSKKSVSIHLSR